MERRTEALHWWRIRAIALLTDKCDYNYELYNPRVSNILIRVHRCVTSLMLTRSKNNNNNNTGDTDAICKFIDDRNKDHDKMLRERKLRFMPRANRHDQGDAAGRIRDFKLVCNESINKSM